MCTTSHHICRHDKKIIKLLKNKNFKIEIEKTIQFSIFRAKIGGESKSNSRYHIDCKKKQGNGKIVFKVKGNCHFLYSLTCSLIFNNFELFYLNLLQNLTPF